MHGQLSWMCPAISGDMPGQGLRITAGLTLAGARASLSWNVWPRASLACIYGGCLCIDSAVQTYLASRTGSKSLCRKRSGGLARRSWASSWPCSKHKAARLRPPRRFELEDRGDGAHVRKQRSSEDCLGLGGVQNVESSSIAEAL